MSIASIRLSQYSVVVNKNEQVQIKAEVITDTGAIDKSVVEVIVEDKDVVRYIGGSVARYKDYYDTIITIKGVSAGSTTVRVYSVVDSSKYAILNVNVVASDEVPGENYHIPYTIFLAPEEVTVQKNQLFCVRARGMGGDYKSELVKFQNYRGRWEFVPDEQSVGKLTLEHKQEYGGTNTITWFKANAAGTYQIKVYNPTYPEFGVATCTVHVINQKTEDEGIRLVCGNDSVEFYYNDDISIYESTAIRKSPFKTSFVVFDKDGEFEQIEDHTTDIGWLIPDTRVVSYINSEKEFVRIGRGYDYGIVPVTFYLKSNPYIYYPVWVEVLGGYYEKYISPVNPEPTDVVEIELSENVKVVQKGGEDGVVLAFGKNSNGDVGGRIKVQRLDGTTTANVSVFSDKVENGKYRIYIRANADVPDGVIYYNVYCEEFPNVTRLLTVHVVEDPTDYLVPINKAVTGIKLDRNTLSLGVGAKSHLGYTIYPNGAYIQDVSWSSSNSDIVTVDQNGNIVGVSKGNALVTVTTVDGGYTDTCQISVGGYIQVTNLSVSPKSLNLVKNTSAKLTASITPSNATDKTVTWTSQDSSVATVDADGNVTGISAGYTTITASVDGGVIKDVVTVAVFDDESDIPSTDPNHPELNVRSISLSSSNVRMQVGTSRNLVATITYEDGHRTIAAEMSLWSSSDTSIVSVGEDGHIKALAVGVAVVTVRAKDNPTVNVRCTVTVVNSGSDIDQDTEEKESVDYIYRIDYDGDSFKADMLFSGNLGFSLDHPIESVVYYETEDIQKIYWVDGIHPLRFMNFMAKPDSDERARWADGTYFDSNRRVGFDVNIEVSKDNSGNTRANGVAQYLLTYFNEHGQETNYAWISDLIYLSPEGHGGAADGYNSNRITLTIKQNTLDTSYTHFRVYSVFRSALNGTTTAYLVSESRTSNDEIIVVDDGAHLIAQDSSRLLYLGSQPVHANTLTHKDGVLFLGNLGSVGRNYDDLEMAIRDSMFSMRDLMDGKMWKSSCVTFEYSDEVHPEIAHIPYVENSGIYNYENQLIYSSSQITTFKGGEKYRFALKFQLSDGTETDAFWIGDAENDKYPVIENGHIKRVVAKCQIPAAVFQAIETLRNESNLDIKTVQLMIAEATYADRSVKAQGFINPTMFSTWERYNDRLYSVPSWITRPRNSGYACSHFEPVHNATGSDGEIECNFWKEDAVAPVPFYQYENYGTPEQKYAIEYNTSTDADYYKVVYLIKCSFNFLSIVTIDVRAITVRGSWSDAGSIAPLTDYDWNEMMKKYQSAGQDVEYKRESDNNTFIFNFTPYTTVSRHNSVFNKAIEIAYNELAKYVSTDLNMQAVDRAVFSQWCYAIKSEAGASGIEHYYTDANPNNLYSSFVQCENSFRWNAASDGSVVSTGDNYPAYYTKQYMFVDENIVTLNSPELSYEAVSLDKSGLKFRIIGAAKITSGKSDYTVDASAGRLSGKNLMDYKFSWFGNKGNSDGLLSWPLWKDAGLMIKQDTTAPDYAGDKPSEKRNSSDYIWNPGNGVFYWLHMWGRLSSVTGFTDEDNNEFGRLRDKVFANLHYSYETIYSSPYEMDIADVRHFNFLSSQYVQLPVGDTVKAYDGNPSFSLLAPSNSKYPILWNYGIVDSTERITAIAEDAWLWTDEPVQISYQSDPHAVIAFPSKLNGNIFTQTILPYLFQSENVEGYYQNIASGSLTDAILPWMKNEANGYIKYRIDQGDMRNRIRGINDGDKYLFIAELYRDFTKEPDTRYGGVTESAVSNCRFIAAGPQYVLSELVDDTIYGNQGDTYFQRWDCMKTKPGSISTKNGVIDITSVMLETHINIDGRTDLNRGINELASIKPEEFGKLNPVYSQSNNFIARHDLDDDFNLDYYPSSITWTLEKHDSEDVDEWTHVTLANTLKLDGDKGVCQALRRMGNSIIAFQDRGISEILFNSRTQLSTQDGVPVEIANSGKIDGKRYITNKYGCVNKWSIIEGKNALYFVDNINKAFCSFNGQAIDNLSTRLGFGAWFREINNIEPWAPSKFNNIVSYYDKVHSDIYLVRKNDDKPCLVYNETLGAFTSFFDYREVPMITNVEDRLVSFRDNKLWLQNEGLYCNFFGKQYDYWTQYRVTPDPFGDKIWTNIDYRADFFEVLDDNAEPVVSESELINGDIDDTYKEWETFTDFKAWDEYQDTGFTLFAHEQFDRDDVRKKFRIWRLVIPRALKEGTNKHGMDRIHNPWINLLFRKNDVDGKYLMQLHDIVVKYFE